MAIPLRVLVVEDSAEDTELLLNELRRGGYDPTHERVQTAEAMTAALAKQAWDMVIADYTMPEFSAPAALELLQRSGLDLPFIIVSGSIGEDIAVASMKAGAHDYMMKGELKRLIPGIERELREAGIRRENKQAEERFRLVIEAAPNGMVMVDREGKIVLVNSQVETLFGYTRSELIGRSVELLMPDQFCKRHTEYREGFLKDPHTRMMGAVRDLYGLRKDGREFQVEIGLSPLTTVEGTFVLASIIDITERKQVEEQRQRHTDELARFNRLAVGRELRMVELKRQINDLSQQLGKAPPFRLSDIQKDET